MMNGVLLDLKKNTVPKNLKNKFKITEKVPRLVLFPQVRFARLEDFTSAQVWPYSTPRFTSD